VSVRAGPPCAQLLSGWERGVAAAPGAVSPHAHAADGTARELRALAQISLLHEIVHALRAVSPSGSHRPIVKPGGAIRPFRGSD
jgi:hypothetical protein